MATEQGERSACPTKSNQGSPFLNGRTSWLIAMLIAALHAFMAVTAVNTKSPTFDEPQHLTAGYSYWIKNDFRLDPENGNLPARWAALPLLLGSKEFPPLNDRGWLRAEEGRTAHQFFYEVGNDPDRMIADARMMMSIFGMALCLLIFRTGREFFGIVGGLIAELVAAFDPNFLAHSALVTADVAAAFFFTAAIWSYWRLLQKISPARLAIAALSLAGLFLTKYSAPIVLVVFWLMSIFQIVSRREMAVRFAQFRTTLIDKSHKAAAISASWILLAATTFLAIWSSFSFRYAAWTNNDLAHNGTSWHWNYLLEDDGAFEKIVGAARAHHLLPEAYLYGFAYVHKHQIDRPAFLDNQWSIVGFRSFFPRAFVYKTPLPVLVLLALALHAFAMRRSWKIDNLSNPFFLFVIAYAGFAITARLDIGHRHLLPIYPALFVGCGAIAYLMNKNRFALFGSAVAILLLWQAGESFASRPNYLAYFNQIAGGSTHGYKHLVDSSLDWGQDLPALKSWIDNHGETVNEKPLYLGYFGTADPNYYGIDAKLISNNLFARGRPPVRLSSGLYAISATTLQSVYADEIGPWCEEYERYYQNTLTGLKEYRDARAGRVAPIANTDAIPLARKMKKLEELQLGRLCAYFRHQKPIAEIGHSIFVFDLGEKDIVRALYGPPAELEPEVRVAGY